MDTNENASLSLAAAITRSASKQTYYTIRFFADRDRVADAYRAYAYYRWVDDVVDAQTGTRAEKIAFLDRQQRLLDACYRGEAPDDVLNEEWMLVDLVRNDRRQDSGLQVYLRNMMDTMIFDVGRRGDLISQAELTEYSSKLAQAITEAMYYFIGHNDPSPDHQGRYSAVTAAHITHLLRDTVEDIRNGYFNIPGEVLQTGGLDPRNVESKAYRQWVCGRAKLARNLFKEGRECTALVKNWRCRLAGYAYIARFEWVLRLIERQHFCLHSEYPERKSLVAAFWMGWSTLVSMFVPGWINALNGRTE